ncbi:MAG: hypothetical protein EKK57_08940 [Proteobacteria bacterium]|nr:MAG: hypothetical protein EKK57_08940 [Pseudomonadota bacterium]
MKPQYNNFYFSSTLLWLDNLLLDKGQAYYNKGSLFYPVNQYYNGIYAYAAPYKQFAYDSSISGANIITGVYLNGNYTTIGQNGFLGINYEEGLALFDREIKVPISGNYAAKEIDVKSINENDEYLLIQNKFYNKNNILTATGNLTNQQPFPVIYVRNDDSENTPSAFGGEYATNNITRLIIMADSQFQLDATVSLITDRIQTYYPLFDLNEMPFNVLGGLKNGTFNYNGFITDKIRTGKSIFIKEVSMTRLSSVILSELRKINTQIYVGIVDLHTEFFRYPRC